MVCIQFLYNKGLESIWKESSRHQVSQLLYLTTLYYVLAFSVCFVWWMIMTIKLSPSLRPPWSYRSHRETETTCCIKDYSTIILILICRPLLRYDRERTNNNIVTTTVGPGDKVREPCGIELPEKRLNIYGKLDNGACSDAMCLLWCYNVARTAAAAAAAAATLIPPCGFVRINTSPAGAQL